LVVVVDVLVFVEEIGGGGGDDGLIFVRDVGLLNSRSEVSTAP
jgi:hypothetical protein